MTRFCDLPQDLVCQNILTKVPITSLKALRSTCKLWNDASHELIVGKTTSRQHEYLGFMTTCSNVFSVRCDLQGICSGTNDLVNLSIKKIALPSVIQHIVHCDGLLLCVTDGKSKLGVWNPYLGQIRWIRQPFRLLETYTHALGYDNNRNYKILRLSCRSLAGVELKIYNFISDSWKVLETTSHSVIKKILPCVTLKGNTYFSSINDEKYNLICFDFTRERFGQRLPLPFTSYIRDIVTLACVRGEQLAVLKLGPWKRLEIWVTNKIEPNAVSWSKIFFKVDITPLTGFQFGWESGKYFFIDEEKKLVVVFEVGGENNPHLTAHIIGEDGYFKSVSLGENLDARLPRSFPFPIISSSYLPSLVQIKQPHQRNERDA